MEMIRQQAAFNRTNSSNPFGSTQWSGDENTGFTQTQSFSPEMQAGLDRIMGRMTDDSQGYQRPEQMGQMLQGLMDKRQGIQTTGSTFSQPDGDGGYAYQSAPVGDFGAPPTQSTAEQQAPPNQVMPPDPGQGNQMQALARALGGFQGNGPGQLQLPSLDDPQKMQPFNPFMGIR